MKTIFLSLFVYLLFSTIAMARPFYPPKNLNWGMTPEEIRSELSESLDKKPVELKGLSKNNKKKGFFPDKMLPDGYRAADMKHVRIFNKKAYYAFAVFDDDTRLVAIQYQFTETDVGDNYKDFWSFFKKLNRGLIAKYGEPSAGNLSDLAIDRRMSEDATYFIWWTQDDSDEFIRINLYKFIGLQYRLILEYGSSAWFDNMTSELENDEESLNSSDDF